LNKSREAPKSKAIVDKLIFWYGLEVYDVLGITRPEITTTLAESFPHMRPDVRERLAAALAEINDRSKDAPENMDEIIRDALKQNGFKLAE